MVDDPRVLRSKRSILDAARSLLSEHGFAGASVEAIAERSGVAKTTIYRHWPDSNAIVMAVFADFATEVAAPVTGDLRSDLIESLAGLRMNLVSGHWAAMFTAMMDAAERDPAFRKLSQRYLEAKRRAIRRRLELAVTQGELPATTVAELLLAMLAGPLFYRRYVARQSLNGADMIEQIVDSALRGFGWKQPSTR
jgi:AcrR family transcriptional regulator